MSAARHQNVLHLEVAVDDVLPMKVVEGDHDLGELGMSVQEGSDEVFRNGLREPVVGLLLHEGEEVSFRVVVGHEIEVQRVLEAEPQFHNEGTIDTLSLTSLPPALPRAARARGLSG